MQLKRDEESEVKYSKYYRSPIILELIEYKIEENNYIKSWNKPSTIRFSKNGDLGIARETETGQASTVYF